MHVDPSSKAAACLSTLSRGQEATIAEVRGSSPLATRLREFGFLQGTPIRVLRSGGTLTIQLGELRLCMRRRDATAVLVSPASTAAPRATRDRPPLAPEPALTR